MPFEKSILCCVIIPYTSHPHPRKMERGELELVKSDQAFLAKLKL